MVARAVLAVPELFDVRAESLRREPPEREEEDG